MYMEFWNVLELSVILDCFQRMICIYIDDLTRVVILYEIYETSLRRVS